MLNTQEFFNDEQKKEAFLKEVADGTLTLKDVDTIVKRQTKKIIETILQVELAYHLGYEKHDVKGNNSGNSRNGSSKKTVRTPYGEIEIEIPRDRNGTHESNLLKPYEKDLGEFAYKIIYLYASGMSTRDIQSFVYEVYGVTISASFVSMITDRVMADAREWQERPLDSLYIAIFFDAFFFSVREGNKVVKKAVYSCLGINTKGHKEILGFWIAGSEGASYWLGVFNSLKNRGVEDILVACVDGLQGLADAVKIVFPETDVQRCIVHLIRNSLNNVPAKHRKELANDLKRIYKASSEKHAKAELDTVLAKWGSRYPKAVNNWRDNWKYIIPFFKYPPELQKVIYTTNAVEAVHRQFRKITKTKAAFPHDDALLKLLYLAAVMKIQKKIDKPIKGWPTIEKQLKIMYKERLSMVKN